MNLPKDKIELKKEYYSWLNKNQVNLKPTISDAIDSIYNVHSKKFDLVDIENLRKGLELNHINSFALAKYICEFAQNENSIRQILLQLAKHKTAKVRLNIITLCLYNKPTELVNTILINALNDKSKQIRLKVADVILRLNKKKLIEKLYQRVQIEADTEVKKRMQWTYELVNKNWILDSEYKKITVYLKDGGISGFFLKDLKEMDEIEIIERRVQEFRNNR